MKTIEYYLALPYKLEIVQDKEEGGFTAYYPDLPGCITCGTTASDAAENALDAKRVWLEAALEDGVKIKEPDEEKYSGQFKIRIPKSLHRTLSLKAKEEGTSLNQYCVYLLSRS